MDIYTIQQIKYDILTATVADVAECRAELKELSALIERALKKRSIKMSIKPRSGADYVYASFTRGGSNTEVIYIGKHMMQADRENYVVDRTAKLEKATKRALRLRDARIALNGDSFTWQDKDTAEAKYNAARGKVDKLRDELEYAQSDLAVLVQCVRPVGLRRLESLAKEGYEIQPLKA